MRCCTLRGSRDRESYIFISSPGLSAFCIEWALDKTSSLGVSIPAPCCVSVCVLDWSKESEAMCPLSPRAEVACERESVLHFKQGVEIRLRPLLYTSPPKLPQGQSPAAWSNKDGVHSQREGDF